MLTALIILGCLSAQPADPATKSPIPTLQAPPAPTKVPPAPDPSTPMLNMLSKQQRAVVEEEARYYLRFSDGSLWTNHPELVRARFEDKPLEKRAPYSFPLWFCPATGETADAQDTIFEHIDGDRAAALVAKERVKVWEGRVSQVLTSGLLVVVSDDVDPKYHLIYVTGHPLQDTVVDEQSIGLTIREADRFQYTSLFGTRTVKHFEWVDLKSPRAPRTTSRISAEDLALAAYTGEVPRSLPRWKIIQAVIKPAFSYPGTFVGSDAHGYSTPETYQNQVYGWKIDDAAEKLDFDYADRHMPRSGAPDRSQRASAK